MRDLHRLPTEKRQPQVHASDEVAHHSAVLSTEIGIARVRKALVNTLDLWNVSPPDARRWDRVFRAWLAELDESVR